MQLASLLLGASLPMIAEGTPLLALKESNNCAACHKPGRAQRPPLERRCTLDCQGCHIDPSGDGPRNQWGKYYTNTKVGIAALNYKEPMDPLEDKSRYDIHYDGRSMHWRHRKNAKTFPMSSEVSLRVRPFVNYLHLTYQSILLGKPTDKIFRMVREGDRGYRERYAVMVDQLPLNTFVRAYRGQPLYGLRRPNHSLWIRERIGLDQFATTEAVEVGTSPNVPFMRASIMRGDPYAPPSYRQKGFSYHGGLRGVSFGWHVNTSGWHTKSELSEVDMQAYGAGANILGFIIYAEQNRRNVEMTSELADKIADGEEQETGIRVHPSSKIQEVTAAFAMIPGVMLGGILETLKDDFNDSIRKSLFVDIHPIPNFQMEVWRRFETGTRTFADTLVLAHVYLDF